MEQKNLGKLHDIKVTTSNTVEIIRQIGSPEIQGTLNKVKETATLVNEMMQSLKTPEIVQNIENFRLISENMNEASTKIQHTMQQLKETGVIDESTELIKFAKGNFNSFGVFVTKIMKQALERDARFLERQEWYLSDKFYHKGDFIVHASGIDQKAAVLEMLVQQAK